MLYRKPERRSISNHSDKYRCLMRIRQVHGEYSVEHSMERYVVGVVDFSFDYGRDRRRDHRAEYHGEFRATAQRRGHDFGNDLFRRGDRSADRCNSGMVQASDDAGLYRKKRRPPDCLFGGVACDEQTDSRLLFHILYETLQVCSSYRERLVLDGRFRGYSVELCVSGESVIESVLPDHDESTIP